MSFFVVERGTADGGLRMPIARTFGSREEALQALSHAVASGEVTLEGEVFVADLGAALPVLVMPPVTPDVVSENETEDAAREPESPEAPVYDAWAEAIADTEAEAEDDLASALRRAATTLEAEGIEAPASVDALPVDTVPEDVDVVSEQAAEVMTEVVLPAEPLVPAESGDDAIADLEAALDQLASAGSPADAPVDSTGDVDEAASEPVTWPWANVTPVASTATELMEDGQVTIDATSEPTALQDEEPAQLEPSADTSPADVPDSLDSDDGQDLTFVPVPHDAESAPAPRPVIMGDYGPDVGESVQDEPYPAGVWLEDAQESPQEEEDESAESAATLGYEGGVELDLGAYTCDDCVYSNTCPKVGQATPADCGSFQWKPE